MLNLQAPKELAYRLGVSTSTLEEAAEDPDRWVETLVLNNPAKPDKQRTVLNVKGLLRLIQSRLLRSILLPALKPSPYSHGGVAGRNIKSNAACHRNSIYLFTTDISDFYPSIRYPRVYDLFRKTLNCSPNVSRLCTRLTTFDSRLALGLPTSPILADQLFHVIDRRIGGACRGMRLTYTRFVDDISISGPFELSPRNCGISALVASIVKRHGFELQAAKHRFGRLSDPGMTITQLRLKNGRLDVREEYIAEVERQLSDASNLASDGEFTGPFYTESQVRGRVLFVGWVNQARKRQLWQRYCRVDWSRAMMVGLSRGLVVQRKTLSPVPATAMCSKKEAGV